MYEFITTKNSAVAERPLDASCLSVVSFNIYLQRSFFYYYLLRLHSSDLLVHKILL